MPCPGASAQWAEVIHIAFAGPHELMQDPYCPCRVAPATISDIVLTTESAQPGAEGRKPGAPRAVPSAAHPHRGLFLARLPWRPHGRWLRAPRRERRRAGPGSARGTAMWTG